MLYPTQRGEAAREASIVAENAAAPPAQAKIGTDEGTLPASDGGVAEREKKPLPPVVFYAGAGVTLLLAGITTWSGFDTLSAKDDFPRTKAGNDEVYSRATRTDVLLGATIVAGALTAYTGLFLVDFAGGTAAVVPLPGGVAAAASGRF
jgi:hypothetical protein